MSVSKPKSLEKLVKADKVLLKKMQDTMPTLFEDWTDEEDMTHEQFFRMIAEKCAKFVGDKEVKRMISVFMFTHGPLYCKVKKSDRDDFHEYDDEELRLMRHDIRAFSGDSIYGLLTEAVFPLQTDDKVYSFAPGLQRDTTEFSFWKKVVKLVELDQPPVGQAASPAVPDAPVASKEQKATNLLTAFTRDFLQNDAITTPVALHVATKKFLKLIAWVGGFDKLSSSQGIALTQQWAIKITKVIVPPHIVPAKENKKDAKDLIDVITHFQGASYDSFAENVFPLQTTNFVEFGTLSAMSMASAIEEVFRQIVDQMCMDKAARPSSVVKAAKPSSVDKAAMPSSVDKAAMLAPHIRFPAPPPYTFPLKDQDARDLFLGYWSNEFQTCETHANMWILWGHFYKMCKEQYAELSSVARNKDNRGLVEELLKVFVSSSSLLVRGYGNPRMSERDVVVLCQDMRENFRKYDVLVILNTVFPNQADPKTGKIEYIGPIQQPLVVKDLRFALECRIVHLQQVDATLLAEQARLAGPPPVRQISRGVGVPPRFKAGKASKGPAPPDAPMPTPQAREPPPPTPGSVSKGPVRTHGAGGNIHLHFRSSESEEDEQEPVDAAPPAPKKSKPSAVEPVKASSGKGGGPKRAGPKAPAPTPAVEQAEAAAPKSSSFGFALAKIPADVDLTTCTLEEMIQLGKARLRAALLEARPDTANDPYFDGKDSKTICEAALARPRLPTPSEMEDADE